VGDNNSQTKEANPINKMDIAIGTFKNEILRPTAKASILVAIDNKTSVLPVDGSWLKAFPFSSKPDRIYLMPTNASKMKATQ